MIDVRMDRLVCNNPPKEGYRGWSSNLMTVPEGHIYYVTNTQNVYNGGFFVVSGDTSENMRDYYGFDYVTSLDGIKYVTEGQSIAIASTYEGAASIIQYVVINNTDGEETDTT